MEVVSGGYLPSRKANLTLKMASEQVVQTSVANKDFQDSSHPDDHFSINIRSVRSSLVFMLVAEGDILNHPQKPSVQVLKFRQLTFEMHIYDEIHEFSCIRTAD